MPVSHLLLTAPPGAGKTTVIKKVCEKLQKQNLKVDGFFTEEVRQGGERIGFDIVALSGRRDILARISDASSARCPKVGKYVVNVPAFESVSLPVFESKDLDVLVLDEIGKMELFSKPFVSRVRSAFNSPTTRILATIPVQKVGARDLPLVSDLRKQENCSIIQVTRQNRDLLPDQIVDQLTSS